MLSVVGSRSHQTFHNIISNFILSLPLDTRDFFSLLRYVAINRRLNEKACRSSHERRHQKKKSEKRTEWLEQVSSVLNCFLSSRLFSRSWLCSGIVLSSDFSFSASDQLFFFVAFHICLFMLGADDDSAAFFICSIHALDLQWGEKWNLGDLHKWVAVKKQTITHKSLYYRFFFSDFHSTRRLTLYNS